MIMKMSQIFKSPIETIVNKWSAFVFYMFHNEYKSQGKNHLLKINFLIELPVQRKREEEVK